MEESTAIFSTVRRMDPELASRLPSGVISDPRKLEGIASILTAYMSSDGRKFPTSLTLSKNPGVPGGCVNMFQRTYNDINTKYEEEFGDQDGVIEVQVSPTYNIPVAKKVLVVMKSILFLGICPDKDLADACRELFYVIFQSRKEDGISEETMRKALASYETQNYYIESLIKFIETL